MRYLCTSCSYIYNEDNWELEDNIKPWTKFENLWDSYICPVCGELPDVFHEIKDEINYLGDIPMDAIEAEHFIEINELDNNIKVSIWKWDYHPAWLEHRISSIWLYDEYSDLVCEIFLGEDEIPETEFDISDLDDFEIRIRCTIHGVWWVRVKR
jgi:rubredoxin